MPTLTRFALLLAVIGAGTFAAMLALATLVVPEQREMVVAVPLDHVGESHRRAALDAHAPANPSLEAMRRRRLANGLESLPLGTERN